MLTAGAHFAFTQSDHTGQAEFHGQFVQRVLLNQVGAHPRQIAFGLILQCAVEHAGDSQIQHRVAEKLQPFVVRRAETAMRQRQCQQAGVAEYML